MKMKEITQEILSKINISKVIHSVMEKGFEKLAISAIGATLCDIATIFAVFVFLSIVDIATRLIACSYHLWKNMYGEEFTNKYGNLYLYILWIPSSRRWRYVNSMSLRTGAVSKWITYMLLILCASACDSVLPVKFMLVLITSLLACTEMLSVCENLSEANISVAKEIKSLVKNRKEQIK